MATFTELSHTEKNEHHRNIFSILASHETCASGTQDGGDALQLDVTELDSIRDELSAVVTEARTGVQTCEEMKKNLITDFPLRVQARLHEIAGAAELSGNSGIVQDGYANEVSGIGTCIDPGMSTETFIPVSMTPNECTAYYASGGIPARIINKKAGCITLDGVHFECSIMKPEDLTMLDEYAKSCGFADAYTQGITQGLIFGGSVVYPVLRGDSPLIYQYTLEQIKQMTKGGRDFIRYWVTADRWNCVFVPEYNITAQDYMYARSLFIPLSGVRVNTDRMAMIRPCRLPFWGAIQQMGWSTSDFEGWIKDFEAYQIMKMSLPVMAQQSSLMYHAIPADGLIIENGPEFAKQYFKENE